MQHLVLYYSLFILQYSWVYMDQLELVFRLLVHLQLMYLQYNVYLSIVVRTYIIYTHMIQNNLRTPQLVGFARQLGCKKWKNAYNIIIISQYLCPLFPQVSDAALYLLGWVLGAANFAQAHEVDCPFLLWGWCSYMDLGSEVTQSSQLCSTHQVCLH